MSKVRTMVIGIALFLGTVVVVFGFLLALNREFSVMGDPGFFRFDREHGLIHGYDRRETKYLVKLEAGVVRYAQDHKGLLPPLNDTGLLRQALYPAYIGKPEYLVDPNSHKPFAANGALSGSRLRSVPKPADCVLFYQSEAPARYRFIMYVTLDGVVHTDPEPQFLAVKSKLL